MKNINIANIGLIILVIFELLFDAIKFIITNLFNLLITISAIAFWIFIVISLIKLII